MTKSIKNDNRGLTLIELIIGVVILAIVVTPLLHALITGANTTMKNKQYNDATIAAQNIIEDIEAGDMKTYLGSATPIADHNDENFGKYLLSSSVESGGTDFDAKVLISPEKSKIPISNAMDAVFQMQAVDGTAAGLFASAADETLSALKRFIKIVVTKPNDASECTVTVTFEYSGSARDNYIDGDGNTRYNSVPFNWQSVSSMNVPAGNDFSVFLFFSAYYNNGVSGSNPYNIDMGRTTIENETSYSFNLFYLDTTGHTSNLKQDVSSYASVKNSETQKFPTVDLMTNMDNITYKTYISKDSIWQTPQEIEVGLVENANVDRLYNITVEIYKSDKLMCTMNTVKLDYSIQ